MVEQIIIASDVEAGSSGQEGGTPHTIYPGVGSR